MKNPDLDLMSEREISVFHGLGKGPGGEMLRSSLSEELNPSRVQGLGL